MKSVDVQKEVVSRIQPDNQNPETLEKSLSEKSFQSDLGILAVRIMVISIAEIMGIDTPLAQIMLTSMDPLVVVWVINFLESLAYFFLEPIAKISTGESITNVEAKLVCNANWKGYADYRC
jgi:hypothetical protein